MTPINRKHQASARFSVPDWIGLVIGGISALVAIGIAISVFFGELALALAIGLIAYAPLLLALLAALAIVASSIDRRPLLPPASLLAHWIGGLTRASTAIFGLAIGALVGTIAGASIALEDPSLAFRSLLTFLVLVMMAGLIGSIGFWTVSGAIDLARVPARQRELAVFRRYRDRLPFARQLADTTAGLATPPSVLLAGLGLAFLVVTASNMALETLGSI